MPENITRTYEMDLRSSDYEFMSGTTDGSTTYSRGEVVYIENNLGFMFADVAINTPFTMVTKASQVKAAKAAEAIDAGDLLYFDTSNNVVTKTQAADHYKCGVAVESAALGDEYILINFDGKERVIEV